MPLPLRTLSTHLKGSDHGSAAQKSHQCCFKYGKSFFGHETVPSGTKEHATIGSHNIFDLLRRSIGYGLQISLLFRPASADL
jgi:hypothetical protein